MRTEEPHYSDEYLLKQIAAGNTAALGTIAQRYQTMVLSLAYRNTQNWTDAEDIAQEAFIRVFKSADSYQGRSGFKTWLYRIVVNLCLDHHRSKKTNLSLETVDVHVAAKSSPNLLETAEISAMVQRAIHNLPQKQKIAVILHRYENLSHPEISDVTGWTISAVESLLVRAYGNLREALKKLKNEPLE
jgi:RNA polymerase sigma-70 factor (ECF subfamily)